MMASIQSVILRYLIRKTVNWNKPLSELRADFEKMGGKVKFPKDTEIFPVSAKGVNAEWIVPSDAAKEAGLNVELKVWDKMWHTFHMQADMLPEARAALKEIYSYITNKLA